MMMVNGMTEKWIVDDAGTLINIETRENYDYVSDVCNLLNEKEKRIKKLKKKNNDFDYAINEISNILLEAYEQGVSNPYLIRIGKVKLYDR